MTAVTTPKQSYKDNEAHYFEGGRKEEDDGRAGDELDLGAERPPAAMLRRSETAYAWAEAVSAGGR